MFMMKCKMVEKRRVKLGDLGFRFGYIHTSISPKKKIEKIVIFLILSLFNSDLFVIDSILYSEDNPGMWISGEELQSSIK